jgi:hypothetical protein
MYGLTLQTSMPIHCVVRMSGRGLMVMHLVVADVDQ